MRMLKLDIETSLRFPVTWNFSETVQIKLANERSEIPSFEHFRLVMQYRLLEYLNVGDNNRATVIGPMDGVLMLATAQQISKF